MTRPTTRKPVKLVQGRPREFACCDTLPPETIPLSRREGNRLAADTDGLYVLAATAASVIDVPARQTLNALLEALEAFMSGPDFPPKLPLS